MVSPLRAAPSRQVALLDGLDDPLTADHVDQVATPGGVDSAGHLEHRIDLVETRPGGDTADLRLLAKGEDVRRHAVVLEAPPLTGRAETGLDFVENQQKVLGIGEVAKLLKEFTTEMIVSTLTLNGLEEDRSNVVRVVVQSGLEFSDRSLFGLDGGLEIRLGGWEVELGVRNPRPVELGEVLRLCRIGVGQRKRVAASAVGRASRK